MKLFILMLFLIGPEVVPLLAQKRNTIKTKVQELTFTLPDLDSLPAVSLPRTQEYFLPEDFFSEKNISSPRPKGGYTALRKYLEEKLMNGEDTTGKKYPISLWNIRVKVSPKGEVDTAYVWIKSRTPLQTAVIEFVKGTIWEPALEDGKPIAMETDLMVRLRLTKRVLKKYYNKRE